MSTKDGGPAFPATVYDPDDGELMRLPGMSLRDWFAGQALAGMVASEASDLYRGSPEEVAVVAYVLADRMLAARGEATDGE